MGSGAAFEVHGDLDRTKRRRAKRTPFDKNLRYFKDEGRTQTFPKATEAQLAAIRQKLLKQQRIDRIKSVIAFALAIPVSAGILVGIVYFVVS